MTSAGTFCEPQVVELCGGTVRKEGEVGGGLIIDESMLQTKKQVLHPEGCVAILKGFPENK